MDALTLITAGFESWLEKRTSGSTVTQGLRLDVFTTSMRDTKPIAANLRQLVSGAQAPSSTDVAQRITDLTTPALVERTAPGQCRITDLGRRVLDAWRDLRVDNDDSVGELVRQVALVDHGIGAGTAVYVDAYRCWQEMLTLHPASEWFEDPLALYMVSYLNADEDGYNPWKAIAANRAALVGISDVAWNNWADNTTQPQGWAKTMGRKLIDPAQSAARRFAGRVTFCMALEARRLAVAGVDVPTAISGWEVPLA